MLKYICVHIFILNKFQYYTNILRIPLHILFDLCLLDLEVKTRVYACVCEWKELSSTDLIEKRVVSRASVSFTMHIS